MARFNHAYTFGFEVVSKREDASDVTHEMLLQAILNRLSRTSSHYSPGDEGSMLDCCDAPFDTHIMDEGEF